MWWLMFLNPSAMPRRCSNRPGSKVLDGLKVIIDGWLEDDKKRPRKERLTSRRVFDRLVAEDDYTGSYSPVQRYIKAWRQVHRQPGDGYIKLTWAPGTARSISGRQKPSSEANV